MKATKTCLRIDCPERYSLCCHAMCRRDKRGFVCKACGKEFIGGTCRAGESITSQVNVQKHRDSRKAERIV